MSLPTTPNRPGFRPPPSPGTVSPPPAPQPINAHLPDARDAINFGYDPSSIWRAGNGTILSATKNGKRVGFVGGQSLERVTADRQAAAQPTQTPTGSSHASAQNSGLLNPQHDGNGNLLGGVNAQTGEQVRVVNGELQGDGKPNPALLQQLKQAPPAANTPAPRLNAEQQAWKDTFGHVPGTASNPTTNNGPTIPTNLNGGSLVQLTPTALPHDVAVQLNQDKQATAPAFPRVNPALSPVAQSYASNGNFNTAQATQDYLQGKISRGDLDTVNNAAASLTNRQAPAYVSPTASAAAAYDQAHPGEVAARTGTVSRSPEETHVVGQGETAYANGQLVAPGSTVTFGPKGPIIGAPAPATAPPPAAPSAPGLADLRMADESRVNQMQADANNAAPAATTSTASAPVAPPTPAPALTQTPTLSAPNFPALRTTSQPAPFDPGTFGNYSKADPATPAFNTAPLMPRSLTAPLTSSVPGSTVTGREIAQPQPTDTPISMVASAMAGGTGNPSSTPATTPTAPPKPYGTSAWDKQVASMNSFDASSQADRPSFSQPGNPSALAQTPAATDSATPPKPAPQIPTYLQRAPQSTAPAGSIASAVGDVVNNAFPRPKDPATLGQTTAATALQNAPGYGADAGTYSATPTAMPKGPQISDRFNDDGTMKQSSSSASTGSTPITNPGFGDADATTPKPATTQPGSTPATNSGLDFVNQQNQQAQQEAAKNEADQAAAAANSAAGQAAAADADDEEMKRRQAAAAAN